MAAEVVAELLDDGRESDVALRASGRYVNRLVQTARPAPGVVAAAPETAFDLGLDRAGDLGTACWREAQRRPPGAGEAEVRVDAVLVDAGDRLAALDRLAPEARALYAGRFCPVGAGVVVRADEASPWRVGDDVVCFGGAGRFRCLGADRLARRPAAAPNAVAAVALMPWAVAMHAL